MKFVLWLGLGAVVISLVDISLGIEWRGYGYGVKVIHNLALGIYPIGGWELAK